MSQQTVLNEFKSGRPRYCCVMRKKKYYGPGGATQLLQSAWANKAPVWYFGAREGRTQMHFAMLNTCARK